MSHSTASFEDRIGKFKAGNALLQSYPDYDPNNPLILKPVLTTFITTVDAANLDVITKELSIKKKQTVRSLLCFTRYDDNTGVGIINPNCAQERIIGVHSYLESIFPDGDKIIDLVKRTLDRIRPSYPRSIIQKSFKMKPLAEITVNNVVDGGQASNTLNTTIGWREAGSGTPFTEVLKKTDFTTPTTSGSIEVKNLDTASNGQVRLTVRSEQTLGTSPSERTFASIPGFLNEVISMVGTLAPGQYNPPDSNLTVTEMEGLHDQIETANTVVANALKAYGNSNRTRKELYDGDNEMADRITMIKSYLASFPGKKKSNNYIEYTQALKGT